MNKINQLLKSCGINSFSLAEKTLDDYQLIRSDGTSASETISEGEKTLITFLYFYHLLFGSDKNTSARDQIVVFDDPISSLDSNILQFVSGLLYEIFGPEASKKQSQDHHIKQCFLLTHNLYFYKMVTKYSVKDDKQPKQDTSFWTIYKTDQGSNIEECPKNPVKSSYELLWEEINRKNKSSIANTIRRILEAYFQMVGLSLRDLPNKFNDAKEKNIARSHIAWINQGSHSINEDLYYSCTDEVMEMQLKIFKNIFEKTKHLPHYNKMMGIEENIEQG